MAKLSTARRNKMPSSTFAVPSRRAFPIPDKPHAEAALRLIGHAHSDSEKAAIRAKANAMLGRARGGMVGLRRPGYQPMPDATAPAMRSPLPQSKPARRAGGVGLRGGPRVVVGRR